MPIVNWNLLCYNVMQMIRIDKYVLRNTERNVQMSKVEKAEKNVVEFEFSVSGADFCAAIEKAYKQNVGKINVQGFRRGKAPRQIIERYYGSEIFYEDAVNIVLPDAYDKAIEEQNIEAVAQPEIDVKSISREDGVVFTAKVAVKPEFELGQYKGVETKKITHRTTEKEINGGESQGETALQHPSDYILALKNTVKEVLGQSGVDKDSVVGIGIDFTSCTVLPIKKDFTPLCFLDEFKNDPHAYVKLWKHHSAQFEADCITETCTNNDISLIREGGKISSEMLFPKVLETINKAPEVFDETDYFLEA